MPFAEEALKIKEQHEEEILKISGVIGVGIRPTNTILVYVEKITPQIKVLIPKTIEGIPTRIIQTGKIVPLSLMKVPPAKAMYIDRTGRFRPTVPAGCSIGAPQITAGTLGTRCIDKTTKQVLGLSNAHVLYSPWGTSEGAGKGNSVIQPGNYDGGRDPDDKIGELDRWIPVLLEGENLVDAACFTSNMLTLEILELGKPDRLVEALPEMRLVKSGRTSGVNYGKVLGISETITVEGWGSVIFKDQITTQPAMLSPGDSGSCILEQDSLRVVGLGHAGSSEISVACKAKHVEDLLNVELVSPLGYLPWYTVLGVLGSVVGVGQIVTFSLKVPRGAGIVM